MKHFVVKIIGGDKIGEGGLYYIAQGKTKWRNSKLTPENSRLPTWLGCFGYFCISKKSCDILFVVIPVTKSEGLLNSY